jgi:hypothetical protein
VVLTRLPVEDSIVCSSFKVRLGDHGKEVGKSCS